MLTRSVCGAWGFVRRASSCFARLNCSAGSLVFCVAPRYDSVIRRRVTSSSKYARSREVGQGHGCLPSVGRRISERQVFLKVGEEYVGVFVGLARKFRYKDFSTVLVGVAAESRVRRLSKQTVRQQPKE